MNLQMLFEESSVEQSDDNSLIEAFPTEQKKMRIGASMLTRFDARWLMLTQLVVLEVRCLYFNQFMRFWCRFATMTFHHTRARLICARSVRCAR